MGQKIPEWESELWSYVSTSDGKHCPFLNQCPYREADSNLSQKSIRWIAD
jgi:hypothetical protein